MWLDYAIYLTIGLVLLAGIGLVVVVARSRARPWAVITLVALVLVGLVATVFVRSGSGRWEKTWWWST